jgi:hypothetical protein
MPTKHDPMDSEIRAETPTPASAAAIAAVSQGRLLDLGHAPKSAALAHQRSRPTASRALLSAVRREVAHIE